MTQEAINFSIRFVPVPESLHPFTINVVCDTAPHLGNIPGGIHFDVTGLLPRFVPFDKLDAQLLELRELLSAGDPSLPERIPCRRFLGEPRSPDAFIIERPEFVYVRDSRPALDLGVLDRDDFFSETTHIPAALNHLVVIASHNEPHLL